MFSRRNLLGAVAGLLPVFAFLKPNIKKEEEQLVKISEDGKKIFYLGNHSYRTDFPNGRQTWTKFGEAHRLDGPATISPCGTQGWYHDGKLHREDGPAVILQPNGMQEWYQKGKLHREDGPAKVHANGMQEWHFEGKRHRTGGPAIVFENGIKQWWTNDQHIKTINTKGEVIYDVVFNEFSLMQI